MLLAPVWSAVADVAEIGSGTTVLDVGCGTGGFCALAAERGALVHGIDGLPDRIERAQRRVPAGDFRVGLMEALPWPAGSFDVVTGFNSFQYAFDVETALRDALRVTRPGGRLAVSKWGRPEDNEFFAFLGVLGQSTADLHDPVDAAFERLGLTPEIDADVPVVMEMADDEALAAALASAGARASAARVVEAAAPWRRPDGGYRFTSRMRYRVVRPSRSDR
jgi:SAM-dependent methyltransferase